MFTISENESGKPELLVQRKFPLKKKNVEKQYVLSNNTFTDLLLLTDVCQQHISRIFAIDRRLSAATPKIKCILHEVCATDEFQKSRYLDILKNAYKNVP